MTATHGPLQELTHLSFIPAPSGSGELLLYDNESGICIVVLMVVNLSTQERGVGLVTITGINQLISGYPNDEARDSHAAFRNAGYGFFEDLGSEWGAKIAKYNRVAFPEFI